MKKLLVTVAIICVVACIMSLLVAAFNFMGYYHLMDGSGDIYGRLQRRAIGFVIVGAVFAVLAVACLILRKLY